MRMRRRTYDAILLLGYGLDKNDAAAPELIARIDETAKAYREGLLAEEGIIIACGGITPGHHTSEADVMLAALESRGVPPERMIGEKRSQITIENMRFAGAMLGDTKKKRVLIITSDYHLLRAVLTAWRAGMKARGRAAALTHDAAWQEKKKKEFLYTMDMLVGWQDEGKSRPKWTYELFKRIFKQDP